ncbi:uncharacterized protein [Callorhinus ursinus]|uniref:uncharacterized protein n=1 Tax=Callorhinus ursinus TaxID=34884 RepID=UPI003CD02B68
MVTAGRTQPPGAALALALSLSLSPPPGQARPPALRPCATLRGRSAPPAALLISPAQSLARGGGTPGGRARTAHWLGRCLDTPSPSPSSAEGNRSEGASGSVAWEQQNSILYPRTTKLAENKPDLESLMVGNEANVKNDLDGVDLLPNSVNLGCFSDLSGGAPDDLLNIERTKNGAIFRLTPFLQLPSRAWPVPGVQRTPTPVPPPGPPTSRRDQIPAPGGPRQAPALRPRAPPGGSSGPGVADTPRGAAGVGSALQGSSLGFRRSAVRRACCALGPRPVPTSSRPCASRLLRDRNQGFRRRPPRLLDEGRDLGAAAAVEGRPEGSWRSSEHSAFSVPPSQPAAPQTVAVETPKAGRGLPRVLAAAGWYGARQGAPGTRPREGAPFRASLPPPAASGAPVSARRGPGAADTRALAPHRGRRGRRCPRGSPAGLGPGPSGARGSPREPARRDGLLMVLSRFLRRYRVPSSINNPCTG